MSLGPIGGSLLSAALQAIFGIGSTVAANKYNSPRAMRNRLKKAGLPLAYMYQGKVMGQSEVPKLSIDPTLGTAQQRRLEQDAPLLEQQTELTKEKSKRAYEDNQIWDMQGFGNKTYREHYLHDIVDEKKAARFIKQHEQRLKELSRIVENVLFSEGVPQELRRQELKKVQQQLINMGKQAGLMDQMKKIRGLDEWMSTRLQDMKSMPEWVQFVVAFLGKVFKPINL